MTYHIDLGTTKAPSETATLEELEQFVKDFKARNPDIDRVSILDDGWFEVPLKEE